MALARPLSALCCLDVVLLEWVIARVCLRCLQPLYCHFGRKNSPKRREKPDLFDSRARALICGDGDERVRR